MYIYSFPLQRGKIISDLIQFCKTELDYKFEPEEIEEVINKLSLLQETGNLTILIMEALDIIFYDEADIRPWVYEYNWSYFTYPNLGPCGIIISYALEE